MKNAYLLEEQIFSQESQENNLTVQECFSFLHYLSGKRFFLQLLNRNENDTHSANEEKKKRDKDDHGEELEILHSFTSNILVLTLNL